MEISVHQKKLLFFRKHLAARPSFTERLLLLRLLAEEEAKYRQFPEKSGSLGPRRDSCSPA